MNFKVQQLAGRPVPTWWEGKVQDGFFDGRCVIADQTYRIVKRFTAGNGFDPEVHEFLITQRQHRARHNQQLRADRSDAVGRSC